MLTVAVIAAVIAAPVVFMLGAIIVAAAVNPMPPMSEEWLDMLEVAAGCESPAEVARALDIDQPAARAVFGVSRTFAAAEVAEVAA